MESVCFRRGRIGEALSMVLLAPLSAVCVLGGPVAVVAYARDGNHPAAVVAMALFGVAPMVAFGIAMFGMLFLSDRKVTVSRHQARVHRWVGGTRTVDLSTLTQLVVCGDPRSLVFLPAYGPALLSLRTQDFPGDMPAVIGEHLGVQLDAVADSTQSELRERYPRNARETTEHYDLDGQWRGRQWTW